MQLPIVGMLLYVLYLLILCTWPFVLMGQLIIVIRYLVSPPKRLIGLGMLTVLVFLAITILLKWLPSPFFFSHLD